MQAVKKGVLEMSKRLTEEQEEMKINTLSTIATHVQSLKAAAAKECRLLINKVSLMDKKTRYAITAHYKIKKEAYDEVLEYIAGIKKDMEDQDA